MARSIIIFLIIFFTSSIINAQNFDAHIELGFNASQVDGDLYSGYNKLGIHGGLGIAYRMDDSWSVESGIFYDALGSQKELQIGSSAPEEQQKIKLNYISLPLYAKYRPNNLALDFAMGVQFSYLMESKIQDRTDDALLQFFNKSDIAVNLRARYHFNDNWSISVKASEAISLIFNNDKVTELNSNSLRNRYLTFSFNRHL